MTSSDRSPATHTSRSFDIAVVGAGVSGLTCARVLSQSGQHVRVFDKARGAGGRMSTRRHGDLRYDHGAQYFTVRDPRFRRSVEEWRSVGLVARWPGALAVAQAGKITLHESSTERWVGVPGMSAICGHLASELDVTYENRIVHLARRDDRWRLFTENGADVGMFDAVVLSAPAPQTGALLANSAPALAARAMAVDMAPCWAAMVSFPHELELDFDGAFVHDSPLGWIARNSTKPGRPPTESWVLHASPEWSREHLELDQEVAAQWLVDALHHAVGRDLPKPDSLTAHRWRFAQPVNPLPESCLVDRELGLAACGDWAAGPRVEGAFLSGFAAARRLLEQESAATPL